MAKASPAVRSFNAGEVSVLVEGRTDIERYPSSNRKMENYVGAPQGPAVPRSGTQFMQPYYDESKKSLLIPFIFSEEEDQSYQLEFADGRVRFFTDDGLLIKPFVDMTVDMVSPFTFTSAALTAQGAAIGMQVTFNDFPFEYNMNAEVATITNKVGDVYTVTPIHPALSIISGVKVALIYSIDSPYTEADLPLIEPEQLLDVIYIFHGDKKTRKLKRNNTYDWVFEEVVFKDGPYMDTNETATRLTPSSTGKATPDMTSNSLPAGSTASASTETASYEAWKAFDAEPHKTLYRSTSNQSAWLQYQTTTPFVCDGYSVRIGTYNEDTSYTSKDFAPSTWNFMGSNDGLTWVVLDRRTNHVLYENNKTPFFELKNNTAYSYYRLEVENTVRNGALTVNVGSLVLRSTASTSITITASATTGINNGQGFLTTDIGRLIRLKGNDGVWRSCRITAHTSTTSITVQLLSEPFMNLQPITDWRLGYWSDTTGYPTYGVFYQDRLWMCGSNPFPDLVASSETGNYESMSPSDPNGVVLDTNAIVLRMNSRRLSRVRWLEGNDKGLLAGTGSQEFIITPKESQGDLAPGKIKARSYSSRGSYRTRPLAIDTQLLFVPRSGRALRETAFSYESDGFKSPSMSNLASHLGVSQFKKLAYAAEPYSIVWVLRDDGKLVGMTYNRDENVVGWNRQEFSGDIVETISVVPSSDGLHDVLWLGIRRIVGGVERRFIEKMTRFWDFDMDMDDAHYVDAGLRYMGDPITEVYGLKHLEGQEVYGLADGTAFGPLEVEDGMITLPAPASNIVVGIGFDAEGETSSLENGAQDGTAQGKIKRIHAISAKLWSSYGGEVGVYNEEKDEIIYTPVDYKAPVDQVEQPALYTKTVGPFVTAAGYEKRGSLAFRRPKDKPYPFIITSLLPQMVTQDG